MVFFVAGVFVYGLFAAPHGRLDRVYPGRYLSVCGRNIVYCIPVSLFCICPLATTARALPFGLGGKVYTPARTARCACLPHTHHGARITRVPARCAGAAGAATPPPLWTVIPSLDGDDVSQEGNFWVCWLRQCFVCAWSLLFSPSALSSFLCLVCAFLVAARWVETRFAFARLSSLFSDVSLSFYFSCGLILFLHCILCLARERMGIFLCLWLVMLAWYSDF